MTYIVELEPGAWLTDGEGDPPRTLVRDNAATFPHYLDAWAALKTARTYRRFVGAVIASI